MPRGAITRQPSKAGRHDKAKSSRDAIKPLKTTPPRTPKAPKVAKGYNPVAPERIHEILKRLDHAEWWWEPDRRTSTAASYTMNARSPCSNSQMFSKRAIAALFGQQSSR